MVVVPPPPLPLDAQKSEAQVRAALSAAQEAHEQAERKIAWRSVELEEQQARLDEEDRQRSAEWRSTIEKERLAIDERLQKEYAGRLAETIKVSNERTRDQRPYQTVLCRCSVLGSYPTAAHVWVDCARG